MPVPFSNTTPLSFETLIKTLEARVAALEQALRVSASQVVLQAGCAKITLNHAGDIQITSHTATISSQGKMTLKAGGDLILKGAKITEN
ncbi:MAG: hypothetical protein NTW28_14060 [Candidatus Solibacter sp.]|nr:hypothetical protein [Candidatus Solibacter sp.]